MKRFLRVIGFVMIITSLMGCNENIQSSKQTDEGQVEGPASTAYSKRYRSGQISELGIIWTFGDPDDFIKFTPVNSNEMMLLCFDPNCKHPATSSENPDPVCMAALYNHMCEVIYHDGAIYIFVTENIGENVLYKMNINGSSRERIATFPFEVKPANCSVSYGNYTYIRAKVLQTDLDKLESIQALEYVNKVVEIDLTDGTYRYISDEFDNHIYVSDTDVYGKSLFLRLSDMKDDGRIYMIRLNIDTGKNEILISKEEWADGYRFICCYDEDSYFYWDRNASEIGIKNINGTVEKVLLTGPEGESFLACPSFDGMMYRRTMDYESEAAGYYFMDFETQEVINITEEVDTYGLQYYDGYYDVFVSDEDNIYATWSKDKILSEASE